MSDIPPDLLDQIQAYNKREANADRWFKWFVVVIVLIALAVCCAPRANAAAYDRGDTYCELFERDPGNGRYYIVDDPAWTPTCQHPYVTVNAGKFLALVEAYESGSGSTPSTSQFTADEVAALKFQAAYPSPFNLSLVDGGLVGGSVLAVWALAAVFKTITRQVSDHFSPSE